MVQELRLNLLPDKAPPAWTPGERIAFRGRWWTVGETYVDTQGASGWHCQLTESPPKPAVFAAVKRSEDPRWQKGDEVEFAGKQYLVLDHHKTQEFIQYIGVPVPPPDSPAVRKLFP